MRRSYIHIIDKQGRWRKLAAMALERAGYRVAHFATYEDVVATNGSRPNLVVLGCARLGRNEAVLVRKLIALEQPLLVLCARLSFDEARSLLAKGVAVADKHHQPALIVETVENALHHAAREYISL